MVLQKLHSEMMNDRVYSSIDDDENNNSINDKVDYVMMERIKVASV